MKPTYQKRDYNKFLLEVPNHVGTRSLRSKESSFVTTMRLSTGRGLQLNAFTDVSVSFFSIFLLNAERFHCQFLVDLIPSSPSSSPSFFCPTIFACVKAFADLDRSFPSSPSSFRLQNLSCVNLRTACTSSTSSSLCVFCPLLAGRKQTAHFFI